MYGHAAVAEELIVSGCDTSVLNDHGKTAWDLAEVHGQASVLAVFEREMAEWVRDGRIRYTEDIVDGLENTVDAFRGLLTGRNKGKLIIRVSDDPTA